MAKSVGSQAKIFVLIPCMSKAFQYLSKLKGLTE